MVWGSIAQPPATAYNHLLTTCSCLAAAPTDDPLRILDHCLWRRTITATIFASQCGSQATERPWCAMHKPSTALKTGWVQVWHRSAPARHLTSTEASFTFTAGNRQSLTAAACVLGCCASQYSSCRSKRAGWDLTAPYSRGLAESPHSKHSHYACEECLLALSNSRADYSDGRVQRRDWHHCA